MNSISFDRQTLDQLKEAYDRAVKAGHETFVFKGNVMLVSYAKYLIEYLETKLK